MWSVSLPTASTGVRPLNKTDSIDFPVKMEQESGCCWKCHQIYAQSVPPCSDATILMLSLAFTKTSAWFISAGACLDPWMITPKGCIMLYQLCCWDDFSDCLNRGLVWISPFLSGESAIKRSNQHPRGSESLGPVFCPCFKLFYVHLWNVLLLYVLCCCSFHSCPRDYVHWHKRECV